jgi:16S rRNA processing protein RimM
MTPPAPHEQWVWLARIRRPQGRKGEVFADILTDFPEKFAERKQLWLIADPESPPEFRRPKANPAPLKGTGSSPHVPSAQKQAASAPEGMSRAVELTAHWLHKGGIVLHFAQAGSISDAETLAGLIVAIPLEERAPLAEDEIYIGDLIGCALVDVAGTEPVIIGQIAEVDRTAGPVALLVVHPSGADAGRQSEVLVPFAKSYLRRIDLEAKRVEMALPEGLVDLNP